MISVLIATINRPTSIKECLTSILQSKFKDFEILLVDQSTNSETQQLVSKLKSKKIKYIKMHEKGKSKALNLMIRKAKGSILAFTDDDCIVDKSWLPEIYNSYRNNPKISGVFGNIYAHEPENHLNEICPATFIRKKSTKYTNPTTIHYQNIGGGGNMSLRKALFNKIGYFKDWLGVGSISQAGEESDLIFRIFLNNYVLMTNPKMVVYHNRWHGRKQENLKQSQYTTGLMAFSSYYLLSKYKKYAYKFIQTRLSERAIPLTKSIKFLTWELAREIKFFIIEMIGIMRGLSIGLVMAISKKLG